MAQDQTSPENIADRGTIMDDAAQGASGPIPDAVGSYDIKGVIGAGAMGVVYLARQSSPERDVAIKVMKSGVVSRKAMRRFEFEAQTLGRLQHPAIAQVYEASTWDDGDGARPYFAMEYVQDAKELGDFVQDNQLDTRARLELFCGACEGVEYGHRRGVIHRDLKPGNILVDVEGHPKVTGKSMEYHWEVTGKSSEVTGSHRCEILLICFSEVTAHKVTEGHQKVTGRSPEGHWKVNGRTPEGSQKVAGRSPVKRSLEVLLEVSGGDCRSLEVTGGHWKVTKKSPNSSRQTVSWSHSELQISL